MCTCPAGYIGDPFVNCYPKPPERQPVITDPCNPSPCGPNANCRDGTCTCIPEYHGDPYQGCRPECVVSQDCPRDKACIRQKCKDPCPGTCGQNARCEVINHVPMCSCNQGFVGNPFVNCNPVQGRLFIYFNLTLFYKTIIFQNQLSNKIHAIHRLVDQTVNAEKSMARQCAHACLVSLERLLLADQNVLAILNADRARPVSIRNVETLAQEPAAWVLDAKLETTMLFAHAQLAQQEIHSQDVILFVRN
jgi:hypothetical protein